MSSNKKELSIGQGMYDLATTLFPICRSITGNGVRQSLEIIKKHIPIQTFEIPSGTQIFDWTIPKEWNINTAWIKNTAGEKIVDFAQHNLHILNYSTPTHQKLSLEDLKPYLYSLPKQPSLIPYRTSYYKEQWGFCLPHNLLTQLKEGTYEVFIDSTLEDGHLTYGELYLPGETQEEVLFTAHICHPSLANDNLSGISLITFLAQSLMNKSRRYSYRFLFIPGTIGSITWLALNEEKTAHIKHGLVVSLVGDAAPFTYKKSRRGNAVIDQAVAHVLKHSGHEHTIKDFFPYGYDERQFCSPGFNLPMGNLTRSQFGQYDAYHTSADDMDLIQPIYLQESFEIYQQIVQILEHNNTYQNTNPKCEPQLGKRGLYDAIGGQSDRKDLQLAMLWLLNYSDGKNSLLDIANLSGYHFDLIVRAAELLKHKGLLVN